MKMTIAEMLEKCEELQAQWGELHDRRRALGVKMDLLAKQMDELESEL